MHPVKGMMARPRRAVSTVAGGLERERGVRILPASGASVRAHPLVYLWPPARIGWGDLAGQAGGPDGVGSATSPGHEGPAAGGARGGPILVVDDDPAILATVVDILELEGYHVITATNGAEALRLIERESPALVLLDMRMPVLDGWGVARELRGRGIAVPVLVMTAARDARHWASEVGADGYLAKPFDLLDLLDAVERLGARPPDE
ncbi:MAG: response regulator [Chloroflexota bacterium]|nr:response regulator [Chloroflexota bacterium]